MSIAARRANLIGRRLGVATDIGSIGGPSNANTPYTAVRQYSVVCRGMANLTCVTAFKAASVARLGLAIFCGGEYGDDWYTGNDVDKELYLDTQYTSLGYDVCQLKWGGSGWLVADAGVRTGVDLLAARSATMISKIIDLYGTTGIVVIVGQSAGGSQCAFALSHYGLAIVNGVQRIHRFVASGGPPHCSQHLGVRGNGGPGPSGYSFTTGSRQIIDASRGYPGDGSGPAQLAEFTPSVADTIFSILAQERPITGPNSNLNWGSLEVVLVGGDSDVSGSVNCARDCAKALRAHGYRVPFSKVIGMPHHPTPLGFDRIASAVRNENFVVQAAFGVPTLQTQTDADFDEYVESGHYVLNVVRAHCSPSKMIDPVGWTRWAQFTVVHHTITVYGRSTNGGEAGTSVHTTELVNSESIALELHFNGDATQVNVDVANLTPTSAVDKTDITLQAAGPTNSALEFAIAIAATQGDINDFNFFDGNFDTYSNDGALAVGVKPLRTAGQSLGPTIDFTGNKRVGGLVFTLQVGANVTIPVYPSNTTWPDDTLFPGGT